MATAPFVTFDERRHCLDGTAMLSIVLFLAFVIHRSWVLPSVGAAGTPAMMVGIVLVSWWMVSRLSPTLSAVGHQPVRIALKGYLLVYLFTYALGWARGLPFVEQTSSDRHLITTLAAVGIGLIATDAIPNRLRLDTLLRRLTLGGAFLSAVAMLQFFFSYDFVERIRFPGLVLNDVATGTIAEERGGFARVGGTAGHPIEFGVVLAMLLPLAMHYLLFPTSEKERRRDRIVAAFILIGIPLSLGRSSAVGMMVAVVGMASVWSRHVVRRFFPVAIIGFFAMRAAVPGLFGTIASLFIGLEEDESIAARRVDYPIVFRFIRERPWFGRGPGTFLPELYTLLDNEILNVLVTTGYVGLAALLAVFVTAFVTGRLTLRWGVDDATRHLGNALATAVLVSIVSAYFADMLFYQLYTAITFLAIGACGTIYRLRKAPSRPSSIPPFPVLRRHWTVDWAEPRTPAGAAA